MKTTRGRSFLFVDSYILGHSMLLYFIWCGIYDAVSFGSLVEENRDMVGASFCFTS